MFRKTVIASALLCCIGGCSQGKTAGEKDPAVPIVAPQPDARASSKGTASQTGGASAKRGPFEKKFDGIRFSVPAGWQEVELAPAQQGFIDARFRIPTPHGDVSLTFSSNSGGIQSNIERWIGQFQTPPGEKPVVEPLEVGGKSATWVDLHGAFAGGAMGSGAATSPIDRMLGVAIPLGSRDFYLKLTGTSNAVADIRDSFREFVRSARLGS